MYAWALQSVTIPALMMYNKVYVRESLGEVMHCIDCYCLFFTAVDERHNGLNMITNSHYTYLWGYLATIHLIIK